MGGGCVRLYTLCCWRRCSYSRPEPFVCKEYAFACGLPPRESNTRPKWVAVTKCGSRPPRSQRDGRAASSSRTLRVTQIINPADTYPRRAPPRIHSHIALLRHRSNSSCFRLPSVKNRFPRVRAVVFRGENHVSLRSQDRERMRDLTQFLPLREYWQALIKKARWSDTTLQSVCDRFNGGNYFTQAPSVLRNSLGGANFCHKWTKSHIGSEESVILVPR